MARKQHHQSSIETLSKCGVLFENVYIKHLRRRPKTFLICGTAVDASVGIDLNHKIDTGELERESVILDIARDSAQKADYSDLSPEDEEKGKSVDELRGLTTDKAVRLVKAHHSEIAPEIEPFKVARRFSVNLDRFLRSRAKFLHQQAEMEPLSHARKVMHYQATQMNAAAREGADFVGEQDIVESIGDRLVVRDTKSSKKTPSADLAHESSQLTAYSLASKVLDGKLPDAVKLDYTIDLKRGVKTATLESTRNLDDIDNYLNRLANSIATIRSGMFVPAPDVAWYCSQKMCGFWDTCCYARGRGRTDISLPSDLTGTIEKSLIQIEGAKCPKNSP
jgi:PD-(D/E)XK nuclease superfamily protein